MAFELARRQNKLFLDCWLDLLLISTNQHKLNGAASSSSSSTSSLRWRSKNQNEGSPNALVKRKRSKHAKCECPVYDKAICSHLKHVTLANKQSLQTILHVVNGLPGSFLKETTNLDKKTLVENDRKLVSLVSDVSVYQSSLESATARPSALQLRAQGTPKKH